MQCNNYFGDGKEVDAIDKTEQIFDFLDVPSFVSLFSGNQNKPFYFVQVTVKGTDQKDLTDPYGHCTGNGENCQDRSTLAKKIQLLPAPVVFAPDEVFDTCVETTEDLYLDAQHFKLLIQKATSYM